QRSCRSNSRSIPATRRRAARTCGLSSTGRPPLSRTSLAIVAANWAFAALSSFAPTLLALVSALLGKLVEGHHERRRRLHRPVRAAAVRRLTLCLGRVEVGVGVQVFGGQGGRLADDGLLPLAVETVDLLGELADCPSGG